MPRATLWLLIWIAAPARAQNAGGPAFSLQNFRPAVDSKGLVTVNASRTLAHLDFSLGFFADYAYRTLALDNGGARFDVDHLLTAQLQGAIGLFGGPRWRDRMHGVSLQLGLSLPVHVMFGGRAPSYVDTNPNFNSPLTFSGQSLGDFGINAKVRLSDSHHPVGLALLLAVDFPTGASRQFLGEGQTTLRPQLIVEREFKRWRLALNLGALVRPDKHRFTDQGTALQLSGETPFCAPLQSSGACGTGLTRALGTQLTYSLGASWALVPQRFDLVGELFGAVDLSGGEKSGNPVEILAAAKVYLATRSFFVVGASAGLLPPRIADGHGNMTGEPLVRVFVGFSYEPLIDDRDHGASDGDEAPTPPPAPPPPTTPSPSPSPEPEPPRQLVARHRQAIVTFDKIHFKTASAEILPRSFPLLDQLTALLASNPDIQLVEIGGHADERGSDDYNLQLTQARAQSVMRYLVEHGIDVLRLTAHGYGEQQPAIDEGTNRPCRQHNEHCWEMNRRVEFRILSQ